ncbi:MAG: hypothetical protein J0M30_14715 [Chitinophagales bacterium]|nr:hypothetical protein [Chitinophagales bacterium]
MKQKNNHARSKRKRKNLRLKNKMRSVHEKRIQKLTKAVEAKKKPFKTFINKEGELITAKKIARLMDGRGTGDAYDHSHRLRYNQRQKRKRRRQGAYCK